MTNNKVMFFCGVLIVITMLFSGCGVYLGPGLTNTAEHLESPAYQDEKASANYVSTKMSLGNRFDYDDRNLHGHISFHRANTFQYGSVTYGAFGYLGNYRIAEPFEIPAFAGNKSYGGIGLMGGGTFHVPFKHVDWEIVKFTTRLYNELGEYPQFKRELISVNREEDYFEDMYVNHGRMVDMAFGTGLKIKYNDGNVTRISTGFNWHAFSQACSDNGDCNFGETDLIGINFQIGHTLPQGISLNYMLASGVSGEYWFWAWGNNAISTFGVSYQF